jgi:hypothetical protein
MGCLHDQWVHPCPIAITDYRFGAKPLISFKTHGKMDAVFASTSWMVPLFFGFRGTTAAKVFEANSFAESSVVAFTDWDNDRAHQERLEAKRKHLAA